MATMRKSAEAGNSSGMKELGAENTGLHKEVYGWRMVEDPFGGMVNQNVAKN